MVFSADVGERIKAIIRRDLKLGADIPLDEGTPFFGTEADIDSLDILLLLTSIEKEFAVKVPSEKVGREIFENVGTLIQFVVAAKNGTSTEAASSGGAVSSAEDYLKRLPHGPEFRFVTKVTAVQPGVSSAGVWDVTGSEPFFAGHFPGNPIVPGVLLAEALAQVAGFALPMAPGQADVQARLAQVDVRFEQPVKPPANIVLTAKWIRAMGTVHQFEAEATLNGAAVARGTISLSCGPKVI